MQERDLRYFKKILFDQMEHLINKDNQTVDELRSSSSMVPDSVDQAAIEAGLAFKLRIRDRESRLIGKIREALTRIEEGTYGLCEQCGEEIALKRLKARPVTTHCIVCKSKQEAGERAIEMNQTQTGRWTAP
jgi:DnaK suppressor protein